MTRIRTVVAFAVLAAAQPAVAGSSSQSRNMVAQMLDVMPGAAIEYCSSQLSDLKPQLKSAEAAFDARITKAAAPFIAKLRKQNPKEQGIPEAQVAAIKDKITAKLKTVDANSYCPALIQKLEAIDTDAFMSNVKRTYNQYLNTSRAQGH